MFQLHITMLPCYNVSVTYYNNTMFQLHITVLQRYRSEYVQYIVFVISNPSKREIRDLLRREGYWAYNWTDSHSKPIDWKHFFVVGEKLCAYRHRLSACLSVCMPVCLYLCLPVCLSVCRDPPKALRAQKIVENKGPHEWFCILKFPGHFLGSFEISLGVMTLLTPSPWLRPCHPNITRSDVSYFIPQELIYLISTTRLS